MQDGERVRAQADDSTAMQGREKAVAQNDLHTRMRTSENAKGQNCISTKRCLDGSRRPRRIESFGDPGRGSHGRGLEHHDGCTSPKAVAG